jgi:hypothetical protein
MLRKYFLTLIVFLISTVVLEVTVSAQEYEQVPQYVRPDYKVFKSMRAALAQPDSVFILELRGKKLKSIPEEIFQFKNLLVLDLKKNRIKTIGQLGNIIELDLSSNKLSKVPKEIGQLTSLRKLVLSRNVITELPPEIGNLTRLEILELWDNELGTLPEEIQQLKQLRVLELRGILFSDEQQKHFRELLPETRIYMSPPCDCKTF